MRERPSRAWAEPQGRGRLHSGKARPRWRAATLLTEAAAGVSLEFGLKKAYDAGSWVVLDKQVRRRQDDGQGAEVVGGKLFPVQTRLAREATAGAKALKERYSPRVPSGLALRALPGQRAWRGAHRPHEAAAGADRQRSGQPDPDTQAAAKLPKTT